MRTPFAGIFFYMNSNNSPYKYIILAINGLVMLMSIFVTSKALSQNETGTLSISADSIPGQLAIQYGLPDQKPHNCSAVYIGNRSILTASHCLKDMENLEQIYSCDLRFRTNGGSAKALRIQKIFIHPEALKIQRSNSQQGRLVFKDLALIQLREEPTGVQAISWGTFAGDEKKNWIGGFGENSCFLDYLDDSDEDQEPCVSILQQKTLVARSKDHFWTESTSHDPFLLRKGDSGGGVFSWSKEKNRWLVIGINSSIVANLKQLFTRDNQSMARYGVHVRIDAAQDWINDALTEQILPTHECSEK